MSIKMFQRLNFNFPKHVSSFSGKRISNELFVLKPLNNIRTYSGFNPNAMQVKNKNIRNFSSRNENKTIQKIIDENPIWKELENMRLEQSLKKIVVHLCRIVYACCYVVGSFLIVPISVMIINIISEI